MFLGHVLGEVLLLQKNGRATTSFPAAEKGPIAGSDYSANRTGVIVTAKKSTPEARTARTRALKPPELGLDTETEMKTGRIFKGGETEGGN